MCYNAQNNILGLWKTSERMANHFLDERKNNKTAKHIGNYQGTEKKQA